MASWKSLKKSSRIRIPSSDTDPRIPDLDRNVTDPEHHLFEFRYQYVFGAGRNFSSNCTCTMYMPCQTKGIRCLLLNKLCLNFLSGNHVYVLWIAQGHSCPALAVAFNYKETYLATSDHSGLIIVWKRWWSISLLFVCDLKTNFDSYRTLWQLLWLKKSIKGPSYLHLF
jgi:hypothetical protein